MLTTHLGELAALATALAFALCALVFEAAARRAGALGVNLLRLALGLGFLSLYARAVRGMWWPGDAGGHAWLWLSLSGLAGFAVGDQCLMRAFVLVGARVATLVMALAPALTALIGWLVLAETLSGGDLSGMGLTMAGIALVVMRPGRPTSHRPARRYPLAGLLLAFTGACGQALGLVLAKYGMGTYSALAATQIRVLAGCAGLAVVMAATGTLPRTARAMTDRHALLWTAGGALLAPFLGVTLSLVAVQRTPTGVAATLIALTPVMILPLAVVFKRERIGPVEVLGTLLAVGGTATLFL